MTELLEYGDLRVCALRRSPRHFRSARVRVLGWDDRKRGSNLRKHGIDLAGLEGMFRDPILEEEDQRRDYGERRIKAIGELDGVSLSVVYTWRGDCRRLISARKARLDEREKYRAKLASP